MTRGWLLCVTVAAFAGCGPSEDSIKAEIEASRTCVVDADCVNIGSFCPFGCSIAVNRSEEARIKGLVTGFASNCQYECLAVEKIACNAKQCTAKFMP